MTSPGQSLPATSLIILGLLARPGLGRGVRGNCLPDIIKDAFAPSTLSFYNDSISKVFPSSWNLVHRVPAYQPQPSSTLKIVFVIFSVLQSPCQPHTLLDLTPLNTRQIIRLTSAWRLGVSTGCPVFHSKFWKTNEEFVVPTAQIKTS